MTNKELNNEDVLLINDILGFTLLEMVAVLPSSEEEHEGLIITSQLAHSMKSYFFVQFFKEEDVELKSTYIDHLAKFGLRRVQVLENAIDYIQEVDKREIVKKEIENIQSFLKRLPEVHLPELQTASDAKIINPYESS